MTVRSATRGAARVAVAKAGAMQVLKPQQRFENLSYLPQLTDQQIAKQIDYITGSGWTPCIEFETRELSTAKANTLMGPGYYDNRYWLMWKLPMYGCTDSSEVIKEIAACKAEYPNAMIKVIGFDATRQMQVAGFLVQKP